MSKNPAAVELGRRGGEARAAALSDEQREQIARQGAKTRWDRVRAERDNRPKPHEVVKRMLIEIVKTNKAHSLFVDGSTLRCCETDSHVGKRWLAMVPPDNIVGTYHPGTSFKDVINDVLATPGVPR